MTTKSGELRETLIEAIELVKTGKMDPNKANAIAKLAGQISLSLQVEMNLRQDKALARGALGQLPLGEQGEVVEGHGSKMIAGSSVFVHRIRDDEEEVA